MTIPARIRIRRDLDPSSALIPRLHRHLPQSIPLLRRIQHDQLAPSATAVVLSTLPDTQAAYQEPWLAAHVDLFCSPETQVFVYSSLEQESIPAPFPLAETLEDFNADLTSSPDKKALLKEQLLELLRYIKTHLLPAYLAVYPQGVPGGSSEEGKVPPPPPRGFLVGSLHTGLVGALTGPRHHANGTEVKIHRLSPRNAKYIFTREMILSSAYAENGNPRNGCQLPENYTFQTIQSTFDFDLVRSRTSIFRSDESLSRMDGVALYHCRHDQRQYPIGWAFISIDGSLSTLHIEPEHRGKGLAVQLAKETMRRAMYAGKSVFADVVRQEEEGYMHVDVIQGNDASRRVMEKIGGKVLWKNAWVVVELV